MDISNPWGHGNHGVSRPSIPENGAPRSASAREGQEPPLVFGDLSELGSQGSSWTALSADAAVDIFMTNRPLRFFTGMKSKCL